MTPSQLDDIAREFWGPEPEDEPEPEGERAPAGSTEDGPPASEEEPQ